MTQDRLQRLVKLYETEVVNGQLTMEDLAQRFGMKRQGVIYHLQKLGVWQRTRREKAA